MEYIIYVLAGLVGVLIHCLLKIKDLSEYGRKANIKFGIKDYLSKDWLGISLSIVMVFVWLLIFGEVGSKYPKILDFIQASFVGMGLFGSYIIQKFFNRGKNYIQDVIDRKTDIADALLYSDDLGGSTPPVKKDEK